MQSSLSSTIGISDDYVEHGNVDVLRKEVGLDRESIVKKVIADDRRIEEEKQSIKHDIKDFERARLIEQYHDKEHECVSATVQKVEPATQNAILTIDKNEVYLVRNEQIPGETLKAGDIIKVYVVGIANPDRKPS